MPARTQARCVLDFVHVFENAIGVEVFVPCNIGQRLSCSAGQEPFSTDLSMAAIEYLFLWQRAWTWWTTSSSHKSEMNTGASILPSKCLE